MSTQRLRVGVVGCGLIAQVMHLPHLRELSDLYEIAALCDLSETLVTTLGDQYGVACRFQRWEDLLDSPGLDAVLLLTSGSHAPAAIAAMQHGLHVFTEKPMCLSSEEGMAMTDAAARAGRVLMVGYMKRYDPAYARLEQEVALLRDLRLVRVTTLESPIAPYVAHYQLHKSTDVSLEVLDALRADDEARVERAIGTVSDGVRHSFRWVLLDSLVHELNLLRGVLGEPTHVTFADLGDQTVTLGLDFSGTPCVLAWVDLPGIARYQQEFAFFSPERRVALTFPSPFLRNMPTELSLENGELGTARSWRTVETTSYHEAFKCELAEFYSCITQHRQARTSGEDGLRDVQLCETIVACHEARHSARKAEAKRRGD